MWEEIVGGILKPITDLVGKAIPDKDKANELVAQIQGLQAGLTGKLIDQVTQRMNDQRDVIVAEANGHSWFQRNWRPLLMLDFGTIITCYMFGLTPDNIPQDIVMQCFTLMKIGIGGYIVGRSVEKAAPKVANIMKGIKGSSIEGGG